MPDLNPIRLSAAVPNITAPVRALPWADQAVCASTDPELFFPAHGGVPINERGEREGIAKSICRRCPVIEECRDYAMADPHLEGTWGGTTQAERGQMRARGVA